MKDKLVFVDIYVDPYEHVYPMQVARGSMKDMWLSKTERCSHATDYFYAGGKRPGALSR